MLEITAFDVCFRSDNENTRLPVEAGVSTSDETGRATCGAINACGHANVPLGKAIFLPRSAELRANIEASPGKHWRRDKRRGRLPKRKIGRRRAGSESDHG